MLVARISFKNAKADQEGLIDASYSVLLAWYKNGQIASDRWTIGETADGLSASVYIPARDALKQRFANRCSSGSSRVQKQNSTSAFG